MIFHPETQKHLMYLKHHLDWKNNDVDAFLTKISKCMDNPQIPKFQCQNTLYGVIELNVKKYIAQLSNLKRPKRDAFEVIRHRCKRFLKNRQLPRKWICYSWRC